MLTEFYQPPSPKLAQGDVFNIVPSLYIRDEGVRYVRDRGEPAAGRPHQFSVYQLGHENPLPQKRFEPNDDEAIANIQLTRAMLLTNPCDFENASSPTIALALIRPMAPLPREVLEPIRRGENLKFFPLPANDEPAIGESYIDFTRITSMRLDALPVASRLFSLSPTMLRALWVALVRCFTRHDIPPGVLDDLVEKAIRQAHED